MKTFADQAVIAIENVRLFNETKEALEQQTATADILRVISSSPTDLQPVFDAIARRVVALCDGRNAIVLRFDGEMLHLAGHHGVSPEGLERNQRAFPRRPWRDYPTGRAFLDRSVVHVPDRQAATEFVASTAQGAGSLLAVPLLREQEAIGVIGVTRNLVGPFSSQQVELLKTFADQAVIAIENVRLFNELQEKNRALTEAHAQVTEALEQQTATSEILRVIASSPTDLQPVLDALAESADRLCRSVDCSIFLLDGDRLVLGARHGPSREVVGEFTLPVVRGTVGGRTVLERRTIHVLDLPAEADEFPEAAQYARIFGFRTMLSVPLIRGGAARGVIQLRRSEVNPFTERQAELLQTFADQAVIAIENVRLFKELEARNRDLTETLEQQTATSDVLRVISQSPTDVDPVFRTLITSAIRLAHGDYGGISFLQDDVWHLAASQGLDEGLATFQRIFPTPLEQSGLMKAAVMARAPVHTPNVFEDSRVGPFTLQLASAGKYHALIHVPLLRRDIVVGLLTFFF